MDPDYGPTGNQTGLRAGSKDWQTIFRGVAGPLRFALRLDRESKRRLIFPILQRLTSSKQIDDSIPAA